MTDATGQPVLGIHDLIEREKARRLQETLDAIEREMEKDFTELARIAAKYNLRVTTAEGIVLAEIVAAGVAHADLKPSNVLVSTPTPLPAPEPPAKGRGFDGTLGGLIQAYQVHPESRHARTAYGTRVRHEQLLRRIHTYHGQTPLHDIKASVLTKWYEEWRGEDNKVAAGHSFIAQIKALLVFGTTVLEDPECIRLYGIARAMRFEQPKPRDERLTEDWANQIRDRAWEMGKPSIALAQAFQSDIGFMQKDVIGEWVPESEPGESDLHFEGFKWLRGLTWEQIDGSMILRREMRGHGKARPVQITAKLLELPMIRQELGRIAERDPNRKRSGPIIVCESTDRPWLGNEFRRWWRKIADSADVPKWIRNMDARPKGLIGSGPITKTGAQAPVP